MAGLNKVILMGNLVADPELRTTPTGTAVTTFKIAVGRRLSAAQKQDPNAITADFINIVAWRNTAEFVSKYFTKGKGIVVVGSLQTRSWEDQNGQKRFATEVIADECYFTGSAGQDNGTAQSDTPVSDAIKNGTFEEMATNEDLPF